MAIHLLDVNRLTRDDYCQNQIGGSDANAECAQDPVDGDHRDDVDGRRVYGDVRRDLSVPRRAA